MGRLAQTLGPICHQRERPRPKHNYRTWERCIRKRIAKAQTPTQQSNLALHGETVPPIGIGAAGHKANHRCAFLSSPVGLPHPRTALAVGRVHENRFSAPIPQQAVLLAGEMHRTFLVCAVAARVQRKTEFLVQRIKQPLRCRPNIGLRLSTWWQQYRILFHVRSNVA